MVVLVVLVALVGAVVLMPMVLVEADPLLVLVDEVGADTCQPDATGGAGQPVGLPSGSYTRRWQWPRSTFQAPA